MGGGRHCQGLFRLRMPATGQPRSDPAQPAAPPAQTDCQQGRDQVAIYDYTCGGRSFTHACNARRYTNACNMWPKLDDRDFLACMCCELKRPDPLRGCPPPSHDRHHAQTAVDWQVLTALLRLPAAAPASGPAVECMAALARALPSVVPRDCAPLLLARLGPAAATAAPGPPQRRGAATASSQAVAAASEARGLVREPPKATAFELEQGADLGILNKIDCGWVPGSMDVVA